MTRRTADPFEARTVLETSSGPVTIYRLERLAELGLTDLGSPPFSIRVWLESLLHQCNGGVLHTILRRMIRSKAS